MKGYTTFHIGLDNQPGNLILIRKDIAFTPITISSNINALAVRTGLDVLTTICSLYLIPNEIVDPIQLNNLVLYTVLNRQLLIMNGTSTHYHERTKSYSNIDLSICTRDISQKYFWVTHKDRCGSDHFPILIRELDYTPETPPPQNFFY